MKTRKYIFEISNENSSNINKLHRILIWGHPDLIWMLKRKKTSIFIDGTFYCVPKPFVQCIVIMMRDEETSVNVPVLYSLIDSKSSCAYWHLMYQILVLTEMKFDPEVIATDFETSLVQAIKEQFPNIRQIGCYFHFIQSLRRKALHRSSLIVP